MEKSTLTEGHASSDNIKSVFDNPNVTMDNFKAYFATNEEENQKQRSSVEESSSVEVLAYSEDIKVANEKSIIPVASSDAHFDFEVPNTNVMENSSPAEAPANAEDISMAVQSPFVTMNSPGAYFAINGEEDQHQINNAMEKSTPEEAPANLEGMKMENEYPVVPMDSSEAYFGTQNKIGGMETSSSTEAPANLKDSRMEFESSSVNMHSGDIKKEVESDPEDNGVDKDEGDEGRLITNLKGSVLYRCITGGCGFTANSIKIFEKHVRSCSFVAASRRILCAHCKLKLKTLNNFLEHLKVHGEQRTWCCLCKYKCWTSCEITKHVKGYHHIMNLEIEKRFLDEPDPYFVAIPKEVLRKSSYDSRKLVESSYLITEKAKYLPKDIDKLPISKIYRTAAFCAPCPYSTKVRSNMVRHLNIHKQAEKEKNIVVPQDEILNPVPHLNRGVMESNKMENLAASSLTSGMSGIAFVELEARKLPQFVEEELRYVCSVCDKKTSNETQLQTHMEVHHTELKIYECPHCQKNPDTKANPDNTVPLDKMAFHLRLHGPKLHKCGHCMVAHYDPLQIETHMVENHLKQKPIHYLIRDENPGGSSATRVLEKWKCFLCSTKTIFGSWSEARAHCETVHKFKEQFLCFACSFSSNSMKDILGHCHKCCKNEKNMVKILVMFSKLEPSEAEKVPPVWKRNPGTIRHIHGNLLIDSLVLMNEYANEENAHPVPISSSLERPALSSSNLAKSQNKLARSKARRRAMKLKISKPSTALPVPPPKTEKANHEKPGHQDVNQQDLYELQRDNIEIDGEDESHTFPQIDECIKK